MFNLSNKASTFVYILLLINIAMIMGIVVFNNGFILNNNINIGKNAEEVFSSVHNKGNIALESVRKYNGNGNGYTDFISCPTNITMSGSTNSGTSINSEMVLNDGSIYCRGYYSGDEFRIYYNSDYSDFIKAYFDWGTGVDIVDLDSPFKTSSGNLLEDDLASVTSTHGGNTSNAVDDNPATKFQSNRSGKTSITFVLNNPHNIGKISFTKDYKTNGKRWNHGYIYFYNTSGIQVGQRITLSNVRKTTGRESADSLFYQDVKSIEIKQKTGNQILNLTDVYVYEAITSSGGIDEVIDNPSEFVRRGDRVYNDTDSTLISFDGVGLGGGDYIDDNFNSDDYKVLSDEVTSTSYFPGFQDDDVVPRKTVFGSIPAGESFENIYWTNYKTIDFIDKNTNNDDILNLKAGDVTDGYMYLDISFENDEINKSYDLKILEFSRDKWKDEFTLFPLSTLSGDNLENKFGYISKTSTGTLYLSPTTGSGFSFDFQNKDYALFLTNYANTSLSYRLTAYTDTGTGIYINPIDDSGDDIIRVLANDIIIGGEKNFIGEEFVIVGEK